MYSEDMCVSIRRPIPLNPMRRFSHFHFPPVTTPSDSYPPHPLREVSSRHVTSERWSREQNDPSRTWTLRSDPGKLATILNETSTTVCLKEIVSRAQPRTGAKLSLCLEYG